MEQILISQNDNQQINILSNEPQLISLKNLNPQDINININKIQDVGIKNSDNQILYVEGNGTIVGITDVLVNGISVVSDGIAYIIVPTKVSQLENDSGYLNTETDPTVPSYIKYISIADINSWNNKQNALVSGSNIKTINGNSLLGSGNLVVGGANYTAGTGINIDSDNVISNTITSYNDLTDLPSIPTETSELINDSGFVSSNDLSVVAFTGSYDDLIDEPTVPTNTSELVNDSGYIDKNVNDLTYYTLSSNLSVVATSGDYDDLLNKPTIPTVPTNISAFNNDSGYITSTNYATSSTGGVVKGNTNGFMVNSVTGTPSANTYNYSEYTSHTDGVFIGKGTLENALTGKGYITNTVNNLTNYTLTSNLATVATSGNYNDLSNIPQDSGWQSPTLTANFKDYNNNASNHPKYRKIGKIVSIQGIVTPTTTLASTSDQIVFTLPTGYIPTMEVRTICQGSGMNRFLLSVLSNGNVCIARYGITSQDNISSGNWLPFYVTYFVD